MNPHRTLIIALGSLFIAGLAFGGMLVSARAQTLGAPTSALATDCSVVSCTTYLPAIFSNYPPPINFEITQGVQQPDSPVSLVASRATFVRAAITSTVAHNNVVAWLYGFRGDAPLPGSPLVAVNNPRTLKSSVNRAVLNDTFNFQPPSSWLNGSVSLYTYATNGSTFTATSGVKTVQFVAADPLNVTVVPVNYVCTSGGSGATLPGGSPYTYLTDFTYRTYPVPSVATSIHAALSYYGPCTSTGIPDPAYADWDAMLDAVTSVWWSEGAPDSYYYALLKVYCGGGCIAGIGWVGYVKAAVGFDGTNAAHNGASQTHAHEVGHNHGRRHAPGCGASGTDSSFPYTSGGKGYIGNSANPNYGYDIISQALYAYTTYIDFMSYCAPEWVSDYTYEALLAWNQSHRIAAAAYAPADRMLLVSGSIDPDGRVAFRPAYVLDTNGTLQLPEAGDYIIELLDGGGRILAAYPFAPGEAIADRWQSGTAFESSGFHMTLPYVEGTASLRVRRSGAILGTLDAGDHLPTLQAVARALAADEGALRINWSGHDADGERLRYLVRASTDGGASWQTIGVHLETPAIELNPGDFGGQSVLLDVRASDGLHTAQLRLGPFDVPR